MQKIAFFGFLIFGLVTVMLAFAGGFWALFRQSGGGAKPVGGLLLFMGAALAVMLGSVVMIQRREGGSFKKEGRR